MVCGVVVGCGMYSVDYIADTGRQKARDFSVEGPLELSAVVALGRAEWEFRRRIRSQPCSTLQDIGIERELGSPVGVCL